MEGKGCHWISKRHARNVLHFAHGDHARGSGGGNPNAEFLLHGHDELNRIQAHERNAGYFAPASHAAICRAQ